MIIIHIRLQCLLVACAFVLAATTVMPHVHAANETKAEQAAAADTAQLTANCSKHGTTNAAGSCVCNAGFAGANCNLCAKGFTGYPRCAAASR